MKIKIETSDRSIDDIPNGQKFFGRIGIYSGRVFMKVIFYDAINIQSESQAKILSLDSGITWSNPGIIKDYVPFEFEYEETGT